MNDETLLDVQNKVGDLMGIFRVLLSEIQKLRIEAAGYENNKIGLDNRQAAISSQEKAFNDNKSAFEVEQRQKKEELRAKEEVYIRQAAALDNEKQSWNSHKAEHDRLMAEDEAKIKQRLLEVQSLSDRELKLKADQATLDEEKRLVEKEKAIDRERKLSLDAREQKINADQERIARILPS